MGRPKRVSQIINGTRQGMQGTGVVCASLAVYFASRGRSDTHRGRLTERGCLRYHFQPRGLHKHDWRRRARQHGTCVTQDKFHMLRV